MSGRRLLLFNPRSSASGKPVLPMSLLAVGAALEGRRDYRIIDGNLEARPRELLDSAVREAGAGAVLGLFAGIVVVIRSVGATIPDRLGAAVTTRVSLVLCASGLGVMGLWQTSAGLVTGTVLLGVGVALFTPALFALAVEGVPADERGSVMGTTSAFLDLAFGLGPATLGFVAASVGRGGTFIAGAVVAAVGLVIVLGTRLGRT